ncbi:hypothetical protein ACWIGI_32565 [Nocardia sp. NPDC055321]
MGRSYALTLLARISAQTCYRPVEDFGCVLDQLDEQRGPPGLDIPGEQLDRAVRLVGARRVADATGQRSQAPTEQRAQGSAEDPDQRSR